LKNLRGGVRQPLLVIKNVIAGYDDIIERMKYSEKLIEIGSDQPMKDAETLREILKLQLNESEKHV
jgi:hypothetical protein